jgi:hypothetical protein
VFKRESKHDGVVDKRGRRVIKDEVFLSMRCHEARLILERRARAALRPCLRAELCGSDYSFSN